MGGCSKNTKATLNTDPQINRQREREVEGGMYEGWVDAARTPRLH